LHHQSILEKRFALNCSEAGLVDRNLQGWLLKQGWFLSTNPAEAGLVDRNLEINCWLWGELLPQYYLRKKELALI